MRSRWRFAAAIVALGLVPAGGHTSEAAGTTEPPPRSGEAPRAEVTYLQHSGWVVRTPGVTLVFDYVPSVPAVERPPRAALVAPEDLGGGPVVVFTSHSHPDHHATEVLAWSGKVPSITHVFGWPAAPASEKVVVMGPREKATVGSLRVVTTGSTDIGVGFLVQAGGIVVYHAGDHARWSPDDRESFMAEIDWLAAEAPAPDLAFFAVATGGACDPRQEIWEGVVEAAARLRPRVLFPMHVQCPGFADVYARFAESARGRLPGTRVLAAKAYGERFEYERPRPERPVPQRPSS
jgi:L-ascorbate metabolism protein UlaG (beta-lactamase superfamily)